MLKSWELFEQVYILSKFSIVLKLINCFDRLHICLLSEIHGHIFLTIASASAYWASHKRIESTTKLIVEVLQVSQGVKDAIVTISLHAFAPILIAFHPVFGFVRALSFAVKLAHSDQIESISQ